MNAVDLPFECLSNPSCGLEVQVLACMLAQSARVGARPLLRGLSPEAFAALRARCFPAAKLDNGELPDTSCVDEFDELFALLLDHATPRDEMASWLAAGIATAAQRDQHLWQDMGLPSRRELSAILELRFPRLAAQNRGDMKWKKFFYRQLCQRAEVPICKSPNCVVCSDHSVCFGPED